MKENRLRFGIISILRRVLLLLACSVFLWSVISPYYRYVRLGFSLNSWGGGSAVILYWSFTEKITTSSWGRLHGVVTQQKWFLDYWFGNFDTNYLGYFLLHPTMFAAQVLALVAGILSVIRSKKSVAAVSAAACLTTLLLMVYQNLLMSDTNMEPYCYQSGYWLTYPSLILFIINFLLTLISRARESRNTIAHK